MFDSDLIVRDATVADMHAVAHLLGTIQHGLDVIVQELRAALRPNTDPWLRAYVCCQGEHVVGIAVISSEEDVDYIRTHYAVERHADLSALSPDDHGALRVCILAPAFEQHSSSFLSELHKLSAKTCLYYMLYPGSWFEAEAAVREDEEEGRTGRPTWLSGRVSKEGLKKPDTPVPNLSILTVLDELIPVAPRAPPDGMHHDIDEAVAPDAVDRSRRPTAADEETGEQPEESEEHALEPPYALMMSTTRFTALPKATVNVRVVVVGASDAGLAFLETLVFSSPEVRYNNLTLLSKNGLPGESPAVSLAKTFMPYRGRFHPRHLASLQLGAWVNVVRGVIVRINREDKAVELEHGLAVPYDLLFLFCGQQFCRPLLCTDCEFAGAYCKHYLEGKPQPAAISSLRAVIERGKRGEDEQSTAVETGVGVAPGATTAQDVLTVRTLGGEDDAELLATCAPPPDLHCPDEDEPPPNLFLLNSDTDVERALCLLHPIIRVMPEYNLVVYGHRVEALTCIAGLLAWGIPAKRIVFVDPELPVDPTPDEVPRFGDARIDASVMDALRNSGVLVNQGFEFVGWTRDEPDWTQMAYAKVWNEERITHAHFKALPGATGVLLKTRAQEQTADSGDAEAEQEEVQEETETDPTAPIRIRCLGVFYFARRIVDPATFRALLDSGLVMDGQLVIDRLGRTNDPFILGGGPLTTYQRKLCIPDMNHIHYSSHEVGFKMAERMRWDWDPVLTAQSKLAEQMAPPSPSRGLPSPAAVNLDRRKPTLKAQQVAAAIRTSLDSDIRLVDLVTTLTAPLVSACSVPGLYFAHVRSPGATAPPEQEQEMGQRIETGDPTSGLYCRLQFDEEGFVREILCLSEKPLPIEAMKAAYGHRKENLEGLEGSSDFVDFFRNQYSSTETTETVYHRQPHWDAEWQHDLDLLFGFPWSTIASAATQVLQSNGWEPLSPAQEAQLKLQWLESDARKALVRRVQQMLKLDKHSAAEIMKACLST